MTRRLRPPGRVVLETARLLLRELTLDDLERLSRLYADPDVRRFFPERTLTLEETREELEWIIDVYYGRFGYGLWATIERSSGEMIGRCGLLPWKVVLSTSPHLELTGPEGDPGDDDRYEVEIAYLLAKERWGHGLATEATRAIVDLAFRTLDVPRLICLVDPKNQASMTVARHAGFAEDGHVSIDDDVFPLLSLTRERWGRLHARNAGEPPVVDLQPDRPDLAEEPPRGTRFTLMTGPEHVLAPERSPLAGYYRAVFSSDAGETLERYLTDAGHAEILRRRGDGDPTLSSEEYRQWTVAPNMVALEARYNAEAGQGA